MGSPRPAPAGRANPHSLVSAPARRSTIALVDIIPAQLFTAALARAKGLDVERPRGLKKVTLTS